MVVDDSADIRELLSRHLTDFGYEVATAANARDARRIVSARTVDLAVVDIMMPGEDGMSLCKALHEDFDIPVILLTARGDHDDRMKGFGSGADDYVTKPFNPHELAARITAVLRRASSSRAPSTGEPRRIKLGRWVFDLAARELVADDGTVVPLSGGEYRLLNAFVEHPNVALSRDRLIDLTKGRSAEPFDRSIDNAVSRLRRKIEQDSRAPELIKTLWGGGYKFTCTPEPLPDDAA